MCLTLENPGMFDLADEADYIIQHGIDITEFGTLKQEEEDYE